MGVTGGIHFGEETSIRRSILAQSQSSNAFKGIDTNVESVSDAVDSSRAWGWFIALTLTSDLLKALFPQATPAQ